MKEIEPETLLLTPYDFTAGKLDLPLRKGERMTHFSTIQGYLYIATNKSRVFLAKI